VVDSGDAAGGRRCGSCGGLAQRGNSLDRALDARAGAYLAGAFTLAAVTFIILLTKLA